MANDRTDHVTMFTLYLSLAVLVSLHFVSFASVSIVKIILHYSHTCTVVFFFQENKNVNLTFAVKAILNLSNNDFSLILLLKFPTSSQSKAK